jgi:hypothetical protein
VSDPTSLSSGTAVNVLAGYVRFKVMQTSADMSAFAIFCQQLSLER